MTKLIIVLSGLVYLGSWQGRLQEVIENGEPTRFELSVDNTTYYVGQPVELTVTLYNDRDKAIKGYYQLGLVFKNLQVYHRRVGAEFVRYFPQWLQIIGMGDFITLPVEIPAGGNRQGKIRLFYNTYYKQFVLPELGECEFKATFKLLQSGENRIYESNVVRVKVVEPPEEEREALAMLRDPELARFIEGDLRIGLTEDEKVEVGAEKAVVFMKQHPHSMYAPMVKEQLKMVLTEAAGKGKLTPKLKELQASLPDLQ
jgi:hypothetical protein